MLQYSKGIISIQKEIFEKTGQRTDAHFKDEYGALFVPEFMPLVPENVIHIADISMLKMHSLQRELLKCQK